MQSFRGEGLGAALLHAALPATAQIDVRPAFFPCDVLCMCEALQCCGLARCAICFNKAAFQHYDADADHVVGVFQQDVQVAHSPSLHDAEVMTMLLLCVVCMLCSMRQL